MLIFRQNLACADALLSLLYEKTWVFTLGKAF